MNKHVYIKRNELRRRRDEKTRDRIARLLEQSDKVERLKKHCLVPPKRDAFEVDD